MENSITLTGRLLDCPVYSHGYCGDIYYVFTVRSGYLRRNRPAQSFLRVYLRESMAMSLKLEPGTFVTVRGCLINSVHDNHKDVSIVAEEISLAEKEEYTNSARLTGTITRVFTNESNFVNFVNFIVSAPDSQDRRSVSLRVVAWTKLASYIFDNLKLGDRVTVIGAINSSNYAPNSPSSDYSESANRVLISEMYCTACSRLPDEE